MRHQCYAHASEELEIERRQASNSGDSVKKMERLLQEAREEIGSVRHDLNLSHQGRHALKKELADVDREYTKLRKEFQVGDRNLKLSIT
jgi:septal ring factor EnvC (AmiA/AmiB activator)